jgi:queuine tRNA-ribosyltransferase
MVDLKIISKDRNCGARTGVLQTLHGEVQTPVFMPVGTRGTVKGILPKDITQTGASIILANTYHMIIRPGVDMVEKLGGLHKMMAWDGPILTDSGGYQVFSLSTINCVGDEGVKFNSHVDGKEIYLDPKIATEVQNRLGADIIMCFDECAPFPCEKKKLVAAVERTIKWARVCKDTHNREGQLLFGITQGGIDEELRKHCAEKLVEMDLDGYAIGGLSVGEGHDNMVNTVNFNAPLLPETKPRYLMGVGLPQDIIAAVRAGVDMFDCVLPTRNGRNGTGFTFDGIIKMRNSSHIGDNSPVEAGCGCYCCENFSRGAVRHFFNVGEMLGPILLSIHNLRFYQRLMSEITGKINEGVFDKWAGEMIGKFSQNT